MKHVLGIVCLVAILCSCAEETLLDIPEFRRGGFLSQTNELKKDNEDRLEGVWSVQKGQEIFGDSVCIAKSGDRLSVFAQPNAGYIIFETGHLDSVVFLQGYWRHQATSGTGLIQAYVPKIFGGGYVLKGNKQPDTMLIVGTYGEGGENPSHDFALRWVRPFTQRALSPYLVIAHRAGGRTADKIPHTENTVELIRIAERFGSNVVEIDVRLSSDGIPFLYHDVNLNPRLVQRGGLVGPPEDYPMQALKDFVTLAQGETIPTLEEAFYTIVHETNLRGVYLDTKTVDGGIIEKMIPLMNAAVAEAATVSGRGPLNMVIGLPTQEHYDEFVSIANHKDVPSLCELSLDQAKAINSRIWAPRWTLGTQEALNTDAHAFGMATVTWTMDVDAFIKEYVNNSQFDGILTNFPSLVRYHQLMRR